MVFSFRLAGVVFEGLGCLGLRMSSLGVSGLGFRSFGFGVGLGCRARSLLDLL